MFHKILHAQEFLQVPVGRMKLSRMPPAGRSLPTPALDS